MKLLLTMFLLVAMVLTCGVRAEAASASISLETEAEEIQVGDTVTVKLVIQGTSRIGGFEAFLAYNSSVLEFQPVDGPIAGGEGLIRISDPEPMERAKKRTYEIVFTAVNAGGCEIAVRDKAYVYEDDGDNEMSVSSSSLSLRVNAASEASDNTRLRTLKISQGELSPEFQPEVTEYETAVDVETAALVISAVPDDEKAAVTVEGNENFTEGENVVTITVKAENADTASYRITVRKEAEQTDGAGDTTGEKEQETDKKDPAAEFSVKKKGDGVDITGNFRYHVTEAAGEALTKLPAGYEPYTLVLYGSQIPAYRKAGETDPQTVLVYVDEGESGSFYELNLTAKTMTRISQEVVEKEVEVIREAAASEPPVLYIVIIVVLAVVCALLGLGMIQAARGKDRI